MCRVCHLVLRRLLLRMVWIVFTGVVPVGTNYRQTSLQACGGRSDPTGELVVPRRQDAFRRKAAKRAPAHSQI